MKRAFVFIATGFEETEAIGIVDVLRRANIETLTVSITGEKQVSGAHAMDIVTDLLFDEADFSGADALVLPGGMPGSSNLNAFEPLRKLLLQQDKKEKVVAALCAAPLVLGGLGLLKGRKATAYPGFESQLTGAIVLQDAVVTDGHIITGKGPGFVFDFALEVVTRLRSEAVAEEVAGGLLL